MENCFLIRVGSVVLLYLSFPTSNTFSFFFPSRLKFHIKAAAVELAFHRNTSDSQTNADKWNVSF